MSVEAEPESASDWRGVGKTQTLTKRLSDIISNKPHDL